MDKIDFLQSYKKLQNLATDLAPVLDLFFTKMCLFLITFLKILRYALSLCITSSHDFFSQLK